ncbi:MAG: antitoxin VbhA family protein [Burkholderiales bacterium]
MSAIPRVRIDYPISNAEQMKRQAAIDFARASVALEGFNLDDQAEALFARYIQGELSREELNIVVLSLSATYGG